MNEFCRETWVIQYGCEEWQSSEERDTELEAWQRFSEVCAAPPEIGAYPADYVILTDPNGETVEVWAEEREGDG